MIILVNRFLFRKKFAGMAIWPFIILRESRFRLDAVFLNHERIHLRQQLEFLVVPFYLWYGLEYVVRIIQYRKLNLAYRNISFEREAYAHEKDINYLRNRPLWQFCKYI